jgi:hypothetical protein
MKADRSRPGKTGSVFFRRGRSRPQKVGFHAVRYKILQARASRSEAHINPEFRFTVGMLNMNVRPPLLAGKEIKPEPFDPQDRGTHRIPA